MYDTKTLRVRSGGRWVATAGAADLSNYATTAYVDDSIARIPAADAYTKTEVDAKVNVLALDIQAVNDQTAAYFQLFSDGLQPTFDAKADKATTYTKAEVDAKLPDITAEIIVAAIKDADIEPSNVRTQTLYFDSVAVAGLNGRIVTANDSGKMGTVALLSDLEAVSTPDLSAYAKTVDNTQNIVANATVAKGYTFGDSLSPNNPGLVYTDTGEGYGPRLVLDTPTGKELIPYQSDFEPIKARMEALESKAAPTVDLAPYVTLVDADARYGKAEAVTLLQGQLQTIFSSLYTQVEADARFAPLTTTYTKTDCDTKFLTTVDIARFPFRDDVYTQKQCEDRFIRIEDAFSKIDFDNRMVTTLYSRKQIDDKLTAISPLGSPSINDPALADFKQTVLDEVKKLMTGGKALPADIDWTPCTKLLGTGNVDARVLNGMIQLRGDLTYTHTATGTFASVLRLPANFPKPPVEQTVSVFAIDTGVSYRRGFVRFGTEGNIGIVGDGKITATTMTGAQAYSY